AGGICPRSQGANGDKFQAACLFRSTRQINRIGGSGNCFCQLECWSGRNFYARGDLLMASSGKGNFWFGLKSLALCASAFLLLSPLSAKAQGEGDDASLRAGAREYEKAYAKGDAKALADMWTPDGTYTDSDGEKFVGRQAIQDLFTKDFKA